MRLRSTSTKQPVADVHVRNMAEKNEREMPQILTRSRFHITPITLAAPTVKAMLQGHPRLFGLNERTNQSVCIPGAINTLGYSPHMAICLKTKNTGVYRATASNAFSSRQCGCLRTCLGGFLIAKMSQVAAPKGLALGRSAYSAALPLLSSDAP